MPANKRATTADAAFVITRVFEAPLPLVWKAWSQAEQLKALTKGESAVSVTEGTGEE